MARSKAIANATFETIQSRIFGSTEPNSNAHLGDALTWYSSMKDTSDARRYLNTYLEEFNRLEDIETLERVPDEWVKNTAGWLARLAMEGYPLQETNIEFLERQLKETLKHAVVPEAEPIIIKLSPNIQQRIREKASDLIADIEGQIDDKTITPKWSLYDYLRGLGTSAMIANKLIDHFRPLAAELIEAFDSKDKDLKEAYKKYSNAELERLAIIYQNLLDDAVRYASNAKKARRPRAKKKPTVEKLLRHFQYQKSNEELKLVSLDPAKIIAAQELWTYNTKSKLLSVFRANDSDGLNVRRSAIININEQTSMAKKIGRKTEGRLQSVLTGGRVVLRNMMEEITGSSKPVTRIGKTTVLLRVL